MAASYATLAMAAARWATRHASKGPERGRMPLMPDVRAFDFRIAESMLDEGAS